MDALADFREVWLCDFEFSAPAGERPTPLCMVAREHRTGRTLRLWRDDLARLSRPPFGIGPDALFVAYYASAELGCLLALDWPAPAHILDLFAEFRCLTSGLTVPCGNGLLGALSWHGLGGLAAVEKDTMRQLALRGEPYTPDERRALLEYCESDVDALTRLLPAMLPRIDLPRALLRGRYMAAAARMEWTGIPIDAGALDTLRANWIAIQNRLIDRIDAGRGIYSGRSFKAERFGAWLIEQGIPWPRLASGALDLSDDAFHEMGRAYPDKVSPIRELRHGLSQLRLEELAIGADCRSRCLLSAFGSKTGRNQPSNSRFIFGPSTWLRGLIRPEAGRAVAYIDFEQQEFGIAAALSRDPAMIDAYRSGDPYLAFAKQAGAVPLDGTKETHKAERERFKVLSLAVQYGMGGDSLARRLDEAPARGRELIDLHKRTYPRYWQWSDAVEMTAMLAGRLQAAFGWTVHVGPNANPRSLRNFPLQANGAEMLRLACILATEGGIHVCAPVHDALLIEAPADGIAEAVAATQAAMREASELVLPGFPLRTDTRIVGYPDRYSDPRGEQFWATVWELIGESTPSTDASGTPGTRAAKPLAPVLPPSSLFFSSLLSERDTPDARRRTLGPRALPTAAESDGATEAETPALLPDGLPARTDPVALARQSDGATGPGTSRGASAVAGSRHAKDYGSFTLASPAARSQHPARCCPPCAAVSGIGRPGDDPPAAGTVPGSDDPRCAGAESQRPELTPELREFFDWPGPDPAGPPTVSLPDLPPDLRESWQERAGLREFDGGLPRSKAEALALADVLGHADRSACDADGDIGPMTRHCHRAADS
jgi:DNA polymerase I